MKKSFKAVAIMFAIITFGLVGFSSAVYGRFTRQLNPEVSSFGITIATQENIMISKTGETGTFDDAINFNELVTDTEISLAPLKGKVTQTPDGTYESLTLTNSLGSDATSNQYLSFDLYFIASDDMNVYLKGSRAGTVVLLQGDNIDSSFTQAQRERLVKNLRVGFLTYSTTYQPSGTGNTIVYSDVPINTSVYSTVATTTDNYSTFSSLGYTNTPANDTIIATANKNEIMKMKVVIWLEEDGLGDLSAVCNLTLSVRFEAVLK